MHCDVLVIGAGAAGLMAAITAANFGHKVLLVDHANKPGKKILMSGGGRCNFTNYYVEPDRFLSQNPHFCKSALSRYTQWDFIQLVDKHGIGYHEKELGQLFCDGKAKAILEMLLDELDRAGAELHMNCSISQVATTEQGYQVASTLGNIQAKKLVIATGGLSIPTLGATGFGYEIAEQFGHTLQPRRAGLVPFTFSDQHKTLFASLSGSSIDAVASVGDTSFRGGVLFTHRGLSGPAILQISSYWEAGDVLTLNLLPDIDAAEWLTSLRSEAPKKQLKTLLVNHWTKAITEAFDGIFDLSRTMATLSNDDISQLAKLLNEWPLRPSGTEGYRTAEVTLGGVNVDEVSSKSLESKRQPGLYFVGEVLDVTGHLGGFNFQWAWASAVACASAIHTELAGSSD